MRKSGSEMASERDDILMKTLLLLLSTFGEMIGHSMVALEGGRPIALELASTFIRPMVNWAQIERWGVDPDRLPAHTVVVNRPLTLWGQYM